MLRIDNSLLQDVGLGALPDTEKNSLLKHIYETLEMRVGIRLADQMSNEQLDEFERYFEAKDDAGAFKWLETNFPNYKDIVQQEFDKLKAEVSQTAPQILSSSQNAAMPPPAAPGPALAQPYQPPMASSLPQYQPPTNPAPTMPPSQPPAVPPPDQPANPMPPTPPLSPPPPPPIQSPEPHYPTEQPPAGPGV